MAGAILRHGAVTAVNRITDSPFPWGTLAVNVAGSLALGVLMVLTERMQAGPALRRFAGVGLIGAFTTFSAFSWEVVTLVKDGAWVRAAAYTMGSVALGVLALAAGVALATQFSPMAD